MKTLEHFIKELFNKHQSVNDFLPDINDTQKFIDNLIRLLFPNFQCESLERFRIRMKESQLMLEALMVSLKGRLKGQPEEQSSFFFNSIPEIYRLLIKDADAIYKFDPAVTDLQEVVCAYPGFYSIAVYRIANQLYRQGVPLLPRIMAEYVHGKTGIDIHPGATIGNSFFIDHGTGVVIGETSVIGNNVKIYQGVTLGALIVKKSLAAKKRHPTIGDNVIIYAGSTVLGGETVIGNDSVIGGNVWLTESVPPNSLVYHSSTVKIRSAKSKKHEYDDFSI